MISPEEEFARASAAMAEAEKNNKKEIPKIIDPNLYKNNPEKIEDLKYSKDAMEEVPKDIEYPTKPNDMKLNPYEPDIPEDFGNQDK